MSEARPTGGLAVMQDRRSAVDSLDFFPTPPWATRALVECVLDHEVRDTNVWEPACGQGHMAEVLREYGCTVLASDVHPYVWPSMAPAKASYHALGSFVGEGADVFEPTESFDWIITNPPFNLAVEFAERALALSERGVALLVRSAWLEGGDRYTRLFSKREPNIVAQFCERVPMVKGRWDPTASTATSYCWVVWDRFLGVNEGTIFKWIPPGQRRRLTRDTDVQRFAVTPQEGQP
jgi:predicted RNA methylase